MTCRLYLLPRVGGAGGEAATVSQVRLVPTHVERVYRSGVYGVLEVLRGVLGVYMVYMHV